MKYYFFLLISFFLIKSNAQSSDLRDVFVFEVEYNFYYKNNLDYNSIEYCLIDKDKIMHFKRLKSHDNIINTSPDIVYNITANGGYVINQPIDNFSSLGCCEYNNINSFLKEYFDGKIIENELEGTEEISIKKIKKSNFFRISKKTKNSKYKIKVWNAKLKYCVCDFHLYYPEQLVFDDTKAAYLSGMYSISKTQKEFKKIIKSIIKSIP